MRRVLGGVFLIAGVGGLGWFASNTHAVWMESAIAAAADGLVADTVHGLDASVSGRDITVSGISESAEIDVLKPQFEAIPGRRVVNFDDVEVLPVVMPFELLFDGETVSGVIPSEADRSVLRSVTGDSAADLQLADGEPDAAWGQVAADAIGTLQILKSGTVRLTDQELVVAGIAATPDDLAAFDSAIQSVPSGYTLVTDIEVEDDGTPMRLDLSYDGRTLTGTGKIPANFAEGLDLSAVDFSNLDLTQSSVQAPFPEWHALAGAGMISLNMLGSGTFVLTEDSYRLEGIMANQLFMIIDSTAQQMERIARSILPGFDVTVSVTGEDDGEPFQLSATYDGTTTTMSGKVPADFNFDENRERVKGTPEQDLAAFYSTRPDGVVRAQRRDPTGTWPEIGYAGLDALATLENGTLDISNGLITLNGVIQTPDGLAATTAALGDFPNAVDITFLDDGAPVSFALTYTTDAATVSGKLPADLTPTNISDALGIAVTDDGTTQSVLASDEDLLAPLRAIADALPEIDSLTFTNGDSGAQFDAVAVPGVDAAQLSAALGTTLGETAQVSVTTPTELPAAGTTRVNRFTGRTEVFASGNWLLTFDFVSSIEACAAQSDAILDESNVRFLSGSAELDVQSIRAINGLAALVRKCALEAGLFLTVSGHTDNTGDPQANLALSQARADAVRDAILSRGVVGAAVLATGFGDTQPIADNATEEGKAANRRTEFSWIFE